MYMDLNTMKSGLRERAECGGRGAHPPEDTFMASEQERIPALPNKEEFFLKSKVDFNQPIN